jgi:hypothetical protein
MGSIYPFQLDGLVTQEVLRVPTPETSGLYPSSGSHFLKVALWSTTTPPAYVWDIFLTSPLEPGIVAVRKLGWERSGRLPIEPLLVQETFHRLDRMDSLAIMNAISAVHIEGSDLPLRFCVKGRWSQKALLGVNYTPVFRIVLVWEYLKYQRGLGEAFATILNALEGIADIGESVSEARSLFIHEGSGVALDTISHNQW